MTDYYVNGSTGNDTTGDGLGDGTAWATITRALDSAEGTRVLAGDTLYVRSSVTYAEDVPLDEVGAAGTPIRIVGYTTTITDEGKVTINGGTNCVLLGVATGGLFTKFENFIFDSATGTAVDYGIGADNGVFQNCEFTNSAAGFSGDNDFTFFRCVFSTNSGVAANLDQAGVFIECRFTANSGSPVVNCNNGVFAFCEFYNNAGNIQLSFDTNIGPHVVINCTFDGENNATSEGIVQDHATSPNPLVAINNILYDLGTGIRTDVAQTGSLYHIIGNNLINSNTTDYAANCANSIGGDVTGAPVFTNEAGDDYSLGASPAIDAGTDAGDLP